MKTENLTVDVDAEGIAFVTLDVAGESLNTLGVAVLKDIDKVISDLQASPDVKAMIFASGKEGSFVAGADLREISRVFSTPSLADTIINQGHSLLNRIAALPFPTVAVINGICVGGGTELALAFSYRLCTDYAKTAIGLPEVTLGIMPGWGGTQRCPRLIGLQPALNMILSGKTLSPKEALRTHLVDAVVPWPFANQEAIGFVHEILNNSGAKKVAQKRQKRGFMAWLLEKNPVGRAFLFWQTEKQVRKRTKGHYPAPLIALHTIKETYELPLDQGLKREKEVFLESVSGPFMIAPNLVGIFFAQEMAKKDKGVEAPVETKTIKNVGVLGAGTMGSSISWLFSYYDYPVRFRDIDWDRVAVGYGAIHDLYDTYVRKLRKLRKEQANLKFHRVSGTIDYSGFRNVDIVIEAAVEDIELKKRMLAELESHISQDAIIATNTSSLSVTDLAKALRHPERFIGMHFFNPVSRMPLVEIVPGTQTSPETVATAVALCKKVGKVPLVVKDCAGFLVNRILVMGLSETARMLEEGVDMERIAKLQLDFGMPMDPFLLADEIGNDVTYKVGGIFEAAYGARMKGPALAKLMYDEHLYGKKVGKGFYVYHGEKHTSNKTVQKLIKKLSIPKTEITDQSINDRILLPMINEAARCLEEGVVSKPAYVDLGLVLGAGFPPFRGGILHYADSIGVDTVVNGLQELTGRYGDRFAPCDTLLEMQRQGSKFY